MKKITLALLLMITFPLFGQKVITDKAIFTCTPLDKVWFTKRISHYNDTSYHMEVQLDSKKLNDSNSVVLHFADGDCIILEPIISIDKDKYVITYFYTAQFKINKFLIKKLSSCLLVGYSINHQRKNLTHAESVKYMKAFNKIL